MFFENTAHHNSSKITNNCKIKKKKEEDKSSEEKEKKETERNRVYISSSPSCRAASMDFTDSLPPFNPIIHRFR